jgi:hypothetical protein
MPMWLQANFKLSAARPAGRKHPHPSIEAVLFFNNPLKDNG